MIPKMHLRTLVLDCTDPRALATFYGALLGWPVTAEEPDWVLMRDPCGGAGLAFQQEDGYTPPLWPERPGHQQKMLHTDFVVEDLERAAAHALACGARLAPRQFLEDVRVFFDPAGHPFCLFADDAYKF